MTESEFWRTVNCVPVGELVAVEAKYGGIGSAVVSVATQESFEGCRVMLSVGSGQHERILLPAGHARALAYLLLAAAERTEKSALPPSR